jgi:hypothetical protein
VGETLGRLRVPVAGRDRVDEVAIATAKAHPPDRDQANAKLVFHALLSRDASDSRIHLHVQHSRRRQSPAAENDLVSSKDGRNDQP